jgi:hypothetical protein
MQNPVNGILKAPAVAINMAENMSIKPSLFVCKYFGKALLEIRLYRISTR